MGGIDVTLMRNSVSRAAALAMVAMLLLSACGRNSSPTNAPAPSPAAAQAAAGPINATVKFIQIGDDVYMTNILTGKWEKSPGGLGYDPRVVFDASNGVTSVLGNVGGWQFVDNSKVNGVDTQHVRGPVP